MVPTFLEVCFEPLSTLPRDSKVEIFVGSSFVNITGILCPRIAGHPLAQNEKCLHMFLQVGTGTVPNKSPIYEKRAMQSV